MHFIEAHFKSNRVVFSTMTPDQIGHYLFSFFSDEERASFEADLAYCVENSWLHPIEDVDYYASFGKQLFKINPETNDLIITYIAHYIENLCSNLFDPPKVGVNPIKRFIDENPTEGTYSLVVIDSNGNDVTSTYSKL
jgi:hypothetical protein